MNTDTITATTTATDVDDLDNIDKMNNINNLNNMNMSDVSLNDSPGAQLAALREQHGYTAEYVASKLHLRVCMIERLEADDYQDMPEPVFIKGYLRAYAHLPGAPVPPGFPAPGIYKGVVACLCQFGWHNLRAATCIV